MAAPKSDKARRGTKAENEKLPDGITLRFAHDGTARYDVRYRGPDRKPRAKTFRRIADAKTFLTETMADIGRGDWTDPKRGAVTFADYSTKWLHNRVDLRPRTVELYRGVLALHLVPAFGTVSLNKLTAEDVRTWNADMVRAGKPGPATIAKSYRLLRTILNTAVDEDNLIRANPCRLKGAGTEHTAERPAIEPGAVLALADEVKPERRLMVLLAGFCGLRLGEVLALQVGSFDIGNHVIFVHHQLQELPPHGTQTLTEPKTEAGHRDVIMPATVEQAVAVHLEQYASADGWLFTGDKGGPLRRHVWNAEWRAARSALGMPLVRFHDLRHAALTTLASHGATTAEVMAQAGHASPQAALRYQHATEERAKRLAVMMQGAIEAAETDDSNVRAINAR